MKVILLFLLISIATSKVVRVQVESLCPDCRNFVTDSLAPFLDAYNHSVLATVELIFLGKAVRNETNFTCQHKEPECLGNAVLALAKQVYDDAADDYNSTNRFAICFISNWYKYHTQQNLLDIVAECDDDLVNVVAGRLPQDEFELLDEEYKKQPKDLIHSHVPYFEIIVGGEIYHNDNDDDKLAVDLLGYLCDSSEQAKEVPACYEKLKI